MWIVTSHTNPALSLWPVCYKPHSTDEQVRTRDDHGAGVDSDRSLHFGLEQEAESIF